MSLTLYFYKVKKGNLPNARNKTQWACYRRMYLTFDYLERKGEKCKDKNGWNAYRLRAEDMPIIFGIKSRLDNYNYDDQCELSALKWLSKREMDFDKYDFFVMEG